MPLEILKVLQCYEELEAAFKPGKEFCFGAAVHLAASQSTIRQICDAIGDDLYWDGDLPGQLPLDLEHSALLVCSTLPCCYPDEC
jgi:hypothetical protein